MVEPPSTAMAPCDSQVTVGAFDSTSVANATLSNDWSRWRASVAWAGYAPGATEKSSSGSSSKFSDVHPA